ncbi:hypothetical protein [Aeropyrum camini]|uniref:hypothetical protein n=1 Tax=Aeropyrum camini TaxID=229980 RepID=UPI0007894953|nr:hypothetical protein [Aeropyrum camini]
MDGNDVDIVLLLQNTVEDVQLVVDEIEGLGYSVVTVVAPPTRDSLVRILERYPKAIVIIPGGVPGDFREYGGRVVKGTYSLKPLPKVLRIVDPRDLSPVSPAEKVLGEKFVYVVAEVLRNVASGISGFKPPFSPPPVFVLSEVYVDNYPNAFEALLEILYRVAAGADLVVVGAASAEAQEALANVYTTVSRELSIEFGVDPPSHGFQKPGLLTGSQKPALYMSVWEGGELPEVDSRFTTVLPRYGSRDVLSMAEDILRACKWGVRRV